MCLVPLKTVQAKCIANAKANANARCAWALSNVNKGMLVSMKSSHKAYLAHIEETQQESEAKRRKEKDLKKIDGLRKSIKELDERESKAFEMLQSACAFLEEGNESMAKGVADKNMNEIEATRKSLSWHRRSRKKQTMNWKQCTKRNKR